MFLWDSHLCSVSLAEAVNLSVYFTENMPCVWSGKNDKNRSALKCHWSSLLSLTMALQLSWCASINRAAAFHDLINSELRADKSNLLGRKCFGLKLDGINVQYICTILFITVLVYLHIQYSLIVKTLLNQECAGCLSSVFPVVNFCPACTLSFSLRFKPLRSC